MGQQVFTNGRIYAATGGHQAEKATFKNTMIVTDDKISFVGDFEDDIIQNSIANGAIVIDFQNKIVVPGLIDAHAHLLVFGIWLAKFDISHCQNLAEIQFAISQYAEAHPELSRLLCRGWHQHTTHGLALATELDGIAPRPIFIESEDLHSTWCSTSALKEAPLHLIRDADSPSAIPRDENGNPTGLLAEMAQFAVSWHHQIEMMTMDDKLKALDTVFDLYVASGYTGVIDMAMNSVLWDALQEYRRRKEIPIHIATHWLVTNGCSEEMLAKKVDEAIKLHNQWHPSKDPEFCIVGIKLILDGVIDGCTAAISNPFPGHDSVLPPLWKPEEVNMVVRRASDAGMQCAIHAVGDVVITMGIDAIEQANGKGKRHRMEHVEFPSAEDIRRISELEITASIQPGHADPFTVRAYAQLVGPELWERAFPYKNYLDSGAMLAIGTDVPSASHLPTNTLYTATTRKSSRVPEMTTQTHAAQALSLSQAVYAFTAGAAYSRKAESWTGSLQPGMRADFTVLDTEWNAESLLSAKIAQTWSKGKNVFHALNFH